MNRQYRHTAYYYVAYSIIAATIILIITNMSKRETVDPFYKMLLGVTFISCCLLGILYAFHPHWLGGVFHCQQSKQSKTNENKEKKKFKGHHPECDKFSLHTISVGGETYCAGCLGLSIGSFFAIFFTLTYLFLIPGQLEVVQQRILVFLGLGIVFFVYAEMFFPIRNPLAHGIANVLLIMSFCIITFGIFEITGNIFYGLIAVVFSILWLDTRVQLSRLNHARICLRCEESCKMY